MTARWVHPIAGMGNATCSVAIAKAVAGVAPVLRNCLSLIFDSTRLLSSQRSTPMGKLPIDE